MTYGLHAGWSAIEGVVREVLRSEVEASRIKLSGFSFSPPALVHRISLAKLSNFEQLHSFPVDRL
jgi:hypothetical protein